MSADKPFSPETNLRDALVEAFKADEGYLNQRVGVDQELNFDLMADVALKVIKDWTADEPDVSSGHMRATLPGYMLEADCWVSFPTGSKFSWAVNRKYSHLIHRDGITTISFWPEGMNADKIEAIKS